MEFEHLFKAHAPLKDIFFLKTKEYSSEARFQVEMLTKKLAHDKLGLSVGGFFIIEKMFILTVSWIFVLTIVTYINILFSLKLDY